MIKACLFDLFGTLVSTAKSSGRTATTDNTTDTWNKSVDSLGTIGSLVGVGPVQGRNRVAENAKGWLERDEGRMPTTLLPGALDFIRELHRNGIKLASTATDCKSKTVLSRVGLLGLFDYVVDPEKTGERPDSKMLTLAAGQLGVSPRECIAFESTPEGIEAARAAGMRSVAVGDLTKLYRADMGVPSLRDMTLQRLKDGVEVPQHEC